jgi:multiple sugar transport system permease protein
MVIRHARLTRLLICLQVGLIVVFLLAPVAWMILCSFKQSASVTSYPPTLFFEPTPANSRTLFAATPFARYALNSLIVAGGSTLLGVLLGVPASFGISWSRITWPATLTLIARMAPGALFLIPWYILFRALGLLGTYWALIITHAAITLPIIIWVTLSFFDAIPRSVLESAQIDGCSNLAILRRIAIPLALPGIVVAVILGFVFSWNYFLFAFVLCDSDTKTLIAAAFNFIGEGSTNWGALMAAAVVIATPPVLLALSVQKRLVGGLTVGAVKG